MSSFTVSVDPTNPGQFFACCGLLELAERLRPGAEGHFAAGGREFVVAGGGELRDLLNTAKNVVIVGTSDESDAAEESDDDGNEEGPIKPVELIFSGLATDVIQLDWWSDKAIKTWAGSMDVHSITAAMAYAIDPDRADPFSQFEIVYDRPRNRLTKGRQIAVKPKKREPFCFDSLRGPNAHARDVGFSINDVGLESFASPAVEFFCLLGLQRCRPKQTSKARVFQYYTWSTPSQIATLPAAVSGLMPGGIISGYQFANAFRSGQEKLKAYMPAISLNSVKV